MPLDKVFDRSGFLDAPSPLEWAEHAPFMPMRGVAFVLSPPYLEQFM
jgi:hypothetical protein